MALIVQKYGGSVLKNEFCFKDIATSIEQTYQAGHSLIVVVSALKGQTDRILQKTQALYPTIASGPCLDLLMSLGEQQSCAYLGLTLEQSGLPFILKTGTAVGIRRSKQGTWQVDVDAYRKTLHQRKIVIVSGFQALNEQNELITLGRGGSDLTALILAHFLQADCCQLIKDVPGIAAVSINSNGLFPLQNFLKTISLKKLISMAQAGSKIVQLQALQFAQTYRCNFDVVNLQYQGTHVQMEPQANHKTIKNNLP